jgi:hypothetical protein
MEIVTEVLTDFEKRKKMTVHRTWERTREVVVALVCCYVACVSTPSAGHPLTSFSFSRPRHGFIPGRRHGWSFLVIPGMN